MNFGLQPLVSDISISMFKVATVISHPRLKSELEAQAVSIAVNPCPDNIFSAENLINLGREAGEIKPINAIVLIRELENLRKSLSAPIINSHNSDIDISSRFVNKNTDNISLAPIANVSLAGQEKKPTVKAGQIKPIVPRDSDSIRRTPPGRKSFLISDRDRVYQYIAEHKEVKLKELESVFNKVSGRTVRRVTESLMKERKIERVGSPGPASFYRIISRSVPSFTASSSTAFPVLPSVSSFEEDHKQNVKQETRPFAVAETAEKRREVTEETEMTKKDIEIMETGGEIMQSEGVMETEKIMEEKMTEEETTEEEVKIAEENRDNEEKNIIDLERINKEKIENKERAEIGAQIGSFRAITRTDDLLRQKDKAQNMMSSYNNNRFPASL